MPGPWRIRHERLDEFAMVRLTRRQDNGRPYTIAQAAAVLGVTARTGYRYNAELVRAGRLPSPITLLGEIP